MKIFMLFIILVGSTNCYAQKESDSIVLVGKKVITLSDVVVDNRLNVTSFINRIKEDTSFYKAFRNLRVLGFTSHNDIRMNDKDGKLKASLRSKTVQSRANNCRTMETFDEVITGDMYDKNRNLNYYTASMYASLFFTKEPVCNESNIVKDRDFSTRDKSGIEKHKEQLKTLFFNPGKKINGIPFMSNKTAIFEDGMADLYDMNIDMDFYNNTSCYIFKQKVKPGKKDKVVVDEMTTWFNDSTFEVVGRNYLLSYDAGVYDFVVNMEVLMTTYKNLTVPAILRYNGNWKAVTKKRERGVFTATLSEFRD